MNFRKIRFGVLGTSRVAIKGMLPAMRDSEFAELVIIGSRDPEKAKIVAGQFGAKKWGTYEDILASKEIDAIYVSLPNALHEEWAVRAAESGHHVICEKPAAISYSAAKNMVGAAKRNNVRILEGFMFRYHPQHAKALSLIREGVLGNVLRFEGCFGYAMPEKSSNAMNKNLEGGSFNDQAPYPIYSSRMIFGEEPESVLCNMKLDPESGVNVETGMVLNYSGNKIAFASSFFGSYYQSTYSILGARANVRMGRAYAVPRDMEVRIFLDADDKTEEIKVSPADHFRLMIDDFCEEIARGKNGIKNYEKDLLAQARVLEAARISDREKRVVKLSEVDASIYSYKGIHQVSKSAFKKILLTGGSGNLGRAILHSEIFPEILAPTHAELDITKTEDVKKFFDKHKPDLIIHAAAVVKMAQADKDPMRVETNILGTSNLVREVMGMKEEGRDARFVYISTDGVYEGTKGNYSEKDATVPYNNYGWTKLGGECAVKTLPNYCIIRTSFFDPENIPFETAATDMYSSKMPIGELPQAIETITYSTFSGIINIGSERKSHYERYKEAKPSIRPCTFEDITRGLSFVMARDASLDISLWKNINNQLGK